MFALFPPWYDPSLWWGTSVNAKGATVLCATIPLGGLPYPCPLICKDFELLSWPLPHKTWPYSRHFSSFTFKDASYRHPSASFGVKSAQTCHSPLKCILSVQYQTHFSVRAGSTSTSEEQKLLPPLRTTAHPRGLRFGIGRPTFDTPACN